LEDSSAKGVYVFNTMRLIGTWQTETKPESEWGRVECPPIVSAELWAQVNQIIEEQLQKWKKPGKPPTHLFSGLAHCSCGSKMYVAANSPKYFCRKCCNKIPIVDLEAIVRDELKEFFGQAERITSHLQEADRNLTERTALLDTHQREIAKVRDEMTKTHRLFIQGQITDQGFGDFYKPAEERLNQLLAELPKLEAEVNFLKVNQLSANDVLHESATLHDRWPSMEVSEKRKIVEAIIEKVVIGQGEIDITYSHLPTSIEQCKNQQRLGLG
jgi:site-specific DNA recombinase